MSPDKRAPLVEVMGSTNSALAMTVSRSSGGREIYFRPRTVASQGQNGRHLMRVITSPCCAVVSCPLGPTATHRFNVVGCVPITILNLNLSPSLFACAPRSRCDCVAMWRSLTRPKDEPKNNGPGYHCVLIVRGPSLLSVKKLPGTVTSYRGGPSPVESTPPYPIANARVILRASAWVPFRNRVNSDSLVRYIVVF